MTRQEIKNLLEEYSNYSWIGIRGVDEELEIGEELDTSYRWDYEMDRTTYGEENEEDLGGVCATDATTTNWANHFRDAETIEEEIDKILEAIKHNKTYSYKHRYIIVSKIRNPYNYEENDINEAILADAIVIAEVE